MIGYVDEVADSNNDMLLLSPVIAKMPLWRSEINTQWQDHENDEPIPVEKPVDEIYNRVKEWMDQKKDLIQLNLDRCQRSQQFIFEIFYWQKF